MVYNISELEVRGKSPIRCGTKETFGSWKVRGCNGVAG